MNLAKLKLKLENFRTWLSDNGAEILEPTNEWEVLRFRGTNGTSVIYTNKSGNLKFQNESLDAWCAFTTASAWRAIPKIKRKPNSSQLHTIRQRDGDLCFYCQLIVEEKDESVEHLVSLTHGGPNHISNLFLTHRKCNAAAGNLSATAKIRMHTDVVLTEFQTLYRKRISVDHLTPKI